MGVMAAFIFAAQMFNFQVGRGTSGHLLGGVLAAILLGPWAATLVMACVVAVQALVFQDGGLRRPRAPTSSTWASSARSAATRSTATSRQLLGGEAAGRLPAAAIAAWCAVVVGAAAMAVELGRLRDDGRSRSRCRRCVGVHALIGIGEAVITVAALAFIAVTRGRTSCRLRDAGRR